MMNPGKEKLLGKYNNGMIVLHWYPGIEKILGVWICGTAAVCWASRKFVVHCPCC